MFSTYIFQKNLKSAFILIASSLLVILGLGVNPNDTVRAAGDPRPEVRIVAPSTYIPYQSFDVTVYIKNANYSVNLAAYLDVSFPENPSTSLISQSSGWSNVDYFPVGSQIWPKGSSSSMTSIHKLFSASRSLGLWSYGTERSITIRVTPGSSGNININYRGTFINESDTSFVDPTSGPNDQQGYDVQAHTVTAAKPDLDVTSVSANPTTISAGSSTSVTFTVKNQGQAASNIMANEIRLSTNSTITSKMSC